MKIKDKYMLKNIAGDYVVIASGAEVVDLTASFSLNETAAFLWKLLENGSTEQELKAALLKEYATEDEQAERDIVEFIKFLSDRDMLE